MQVQEGYVKAVNLENKLYYRAVGSGDITLLAVNGIGVSTIFWKYIQDYMQYKYRFITMDYIGHGRSEEPDDLKHMTIENMAKDANRVLEELKIDKAVLLGHSMGSQVIFEFYRLFPDKVLGLVPTLGSFGHPVYTFFDSEYSIFLYYAGVFLMGNFPKALNKITSILLQPKFMKELIIKIGGKISLINPVLIPKHDIFQYLEHVARVDKKVFGYLMKSMQEHTAEDLLPKIKTPVFIIAGDMDIFTPVKLSEDMHKMIPNSQLLILNGGSHAALIEQPELINCRLEKFIENDVKKQLKKSRGKVQRKKDGK